MAASEFQPHLYHHHRSTQQQPITTQVDLSFDEVANLFPFPIAEAAATLGVSTNDLKRVCRENGLNRWPYRKIVAGKTVEDVKKEAAREMALSERMARTQQFQPTTNGPYANRSGPYSLGTNSTAERDPQPFMNRPPLHSFFAHTSPPLKPLHLDHHRPQVNNNNQFQMRLNIPTYLDEFRHGFPSKGLSSHSNKWWGSSPPDDMAANKAPEGTKVDVPGGDDVTTEQESEQENQSCGPSETGKEIKSDEKKGLTSMSMLVRTRANAASSGRRSLGLAVTRGYGMYRVADKDEALLRAIFAESFPAMWRASMPSQTT